jgi:predicted PurR-regulated permease PerM
VFAEVLLPFVLAIVLAYVLSPLVALGERVHFGRRVPPRWLVVLTLYLTLLGTLAGVIAFATPRLAAEFQRLGKEAPRAIDIVRKQWLPEFDRRLNAAAAPYLPQRKGHENKAKAVEEGRGSGAAGAASASKAIQIRPNKDGGYDVWLPSAGLRVVPDGERAFRVEAGRNNSKARTDFGAAISGAIDRSMQGSEQTAFTILQTAQQFIRQVVRGVFGFMMMLVVSAYLLVTRDSIFDFARSLYVAQKRPEFDELIRRIDRGLSGVVRGQLIICVINGVLSGIGFYALGLKYWAFLTLIAGVMSIIPIFGSILSTFPAVLLALPQGGIPLALLALGWIVAIHQLEANVLNPKIMGDSARVHPVLVVFALLAGEHIAGLVGALLAVPTLSVTQTLFLYLRERFLGVPRGSSFPPAVPTSSADVEPAADA